MSRSLSVVAAALLAAAVPLGAQSSTVQALRAPSDRLIDAALSDTTGYHHLAQLVDDFGPRPAGSKSLEQAIDWIIAQMKRDGLENVHGEPVMVTHWERGAESASLVTPRATALHMIGLGGSVATPAAGITAPVLVVNSFDDLAAHASEATGKIVLFDYPFRQDLPPMEGYRDAVQYRGGAATAAAKVGAVAALIRSVSSFSIQNPHTGGMRYGDSTVTRIPAAALSVEDAEMVHRMFARGEQPVITLKMEGRTLARAQSRNVVGEIRGSEHPEQVVVLGGHIDSWDVGQGVMDDGGGSVAAWEAVRLMQQLGLKPKRTVRVVLWTNEEHGGEGGRAYAAAHANETHVAAMESDNGIFRPNGFRYTGTAAGLAAAEPLGALLQRVGATMVKAGDGEADIGPLLREGVPGFSLDVDDSRYFWYHHSAGDMLGVVDRQEFAKCVATMAVMAYALAELPQPLPRGTAGE